MKGEGNRFVVLSLWRGPITVRQPPPKSMAQIAAEVAERYGVTVADLRFGGKARRFSIPRQEAMAEMHATGWWTLMDIGRYFGGAHHSTVMHAVRAASTRVRAGDLKCRTAAVQGAA